MKNSGVPRGSLAEGRIIASKGEAGVQCRLLRGGIHFGLFQDLADRFANSKQPLVPERLFITGNDGGDGQIGLLQTLLGLLVSERSGVEVAAVAPIESLEKIAPEGARVTAAGLEKTTAV